MSILINDGREEEDIMKCDIGELVLSVETLKVQVIPFIKILRNIQSILKWERPIVSIIVMVTSIYVVLLNPVYMLLLCLTPIIPTMLIGLLRHVGTSSTPSKTYKDFFVRKDDEYTQELFSQEEKRKHLNMYLDLLVQLQKMCMELNKSFDFLYCIVFWRKKKLSFLVLFLLSGLELLIYTCDISTVLCIIILMLFLCNAYLLKVISETLRRMRTSVSNLFFLKSSTTKSTTTTTTTTLNLDDAQKDTEFVDSPRTALNNREEQANGEMSDTSSSSDSDQDEPVEMKMSSQERTKAMVNSESMMSKLFLPRTWRRRNVENCSQCYQPVSSILKKRRYCRHCGKSFCSRCCHVRVPRSFLGATAPAAYQEKVLVCNSCHKFVTNRLNSGTEIIE